MAVASDLSQKVLLDIQGLQKFFPVKKSFLHSIARKQTSVVKAVDEVSFTIRRGETLGIVGESGCGKSTTGRAIMRLIEPTGGKVLFEGRDLVGLSAKEMKQVRREMQMVFQDPYASLHPRMTIGTTIAEPMQIHNIGTSQDREARVEQLLETVGLAPGTKKRYAHEFSGGQRQRIGIARALALQPKLIVCDEPVSALDVSIQSQVINLFQDLQQQFSLTYLFISHDLSVIRHISDRVGVMYLGKLVELASTEDLFHQPAHPYTQALLSARPHIHGTTPGKERIILQGELPSPLNPPAGCRFHTRCLYKMARCETEEPTLSAIETGHQVACHLHVS
ncbi:ABC transporter ATP-binding protein [Brevibacillus sp. TJ4]|uniref:ABC transporter ATP-binding protein n=1 Tax=Brevibacillus sp. TJ4 TaxID=3234853 RepID=UPI0037D311D2